MHKCFNKTFKNKKHKKNILKFVTRMVQNNWVIDR